MNSRTSVKRPFAAMLALLFGLPVNGWSCEPIIPLYQLLNGTSLVGPALVMHSLSFLSVVLFELAGSALAARSFVHYWIFKFIFVAMAAGTGILISAVLEECVIARLSRRAHGNVSYYTPVLRANYLTLAIVLLVAALEMLPRRLNAPNFIASWLQSLSAMFGFT